MPQKEKKELGPGVLAIMRAFAGHLSRAGGDSCVPAHPPAFANHPLLVPAKLLAPKSHSFSWIAVRRGFSALHCTKMYDPVIPQWGKTESHLNGQ